MDLFWNSTREQGDTNRTVLGALATLDCGCQSELRLIYTNEYTLKIGGLAEVVSRGCVTLQTHESRSVDRNGA